MKRFIVAALLLVAGATTTSAQAEGSLAGFYVGGNLGVAAPTITVEDQGCYWDCSAYTQRPVGLDFGIRGGQNLASGSLLYGWSAEYDFASAKKDDTVQYAGSPVITAKIKSVGSIRGRAGLLIQDTALMVTFGPAFAKFDSSYVDAGSGVQSQQSGNDSGWVFGAALEHSVSSNLSVGADLSHYTFQPKDADINGTKQKYVNTLDTFRLTAAWKF